VSCPQVPVLFITKRHKFNRRNVGNRRGFAPGFVNYKKGCTRLAAASDTVYQLLVHGRWFSPGTRASSTTKTGCHDIAEILLKVALSTINQIKELFRQCVAFNGTVPTVCSV
jgi:hypothetical protein